jgi:hypothetical protein
VRDGGADIGLNSFRCRLLDVFHVLEVVIALRGTGRAAEVIEGHSRDPTLGKTQCQLLVKPVETAYVREDHDTDLARLVGRGREGRKAVPVARLEDDVLMRDGCAADRRDRRDGIELEAHACVSL